MARYNYHSLRWSWIAVAAVGLSLCLAPVFLARAGGDVNQDGCVDLADHAEMQAAFTGPACAKHAIHSFYAAGSGSLEVIPAVPGENGFVITDIHVTFFNGTGTVMISEDGGETPRPLITLREETVSLRSGIPVSAGSVVTASGIEFAIQVSGYSF